MTLPYSLLLQESSRETLSLPLKDNIVIFDEAHNLVEAQLNAYSASLSYQQVGFFFFPISLGIFMCRGFVLVV